MLTDKGMFKEGKPLGKDGSPWKSFAMGVVESDREVAVDAPSDVVLHIFTC